MIFRVVRVCLILLAMSACSRTPDDEQIRAHIKSMQAAVESRSPRDFVQYVTADFAGNDNAVDRAGLSNLLRIELLRNEQVGVTLGPIGIELLGGDRATVHVVATMTGGKGGLIPERGAVFSITSGWRREGKDWRCYTASWEQNL